MPPNGLPRLQVPLPGSDATLGSLMTHNYPYRLIDASEMRILILQPAISRDEPLKARLEVCERKSSSDYEALSYVWGSGAGLHDDLEIESSTEIKLMGPTTFRIRMSLVEALKGFRRTHGERRLWTDAICINQNSLQEKNQQVPMMEQVYSCADRVLVWFGNSTDESKTAFKFMETILNADNFDELIKKEANSAAQWAALEELMRWDWFSRRWIVQEIALAKYAEVWCGDDHVSWEDFCHVIDLFKLYYGDIKANFIRPEYGFARNWLGEVEALGACQLVQIANNLFRKSSDQKIERRLITLESLVTRLTMFNSGREHDIIYALVAIAKDIQTVSQPPKSVDPSATPVELPEGSEMHGIPHVPSYSENVQKGVEALRAHVHQQFGNDKLEVPSQPAEKGKQKQLLDLVDRMVDLNPKFPVNYELSFHRVCIDFVEFAISKSNSLDVILRPWVPEDLKEKHRLPSWLIDVDRYSFQQLEQGTFKRVNGDPLVGLNAMEPKRYSACGPNAPALRIKRKSSFSKDGWGFCCKDKTSVFPCDGDHRSLFVTGFVFDEIGDITSPAYDATIPTKWFDFASWKDWRDRSNPPPPELWRTLVADRETDGSQLPSFYRGTLHSIVRKYCPRGGTLNVRSILETPQLDKRSERVLNRIFAITPNRQLFKTTERTSHLLGLAPENAIKTDKVCILNGCSVPVILRRHEEEVNGVQHPWYELIGDAYVNGIMEGHAMDENERMPSFHPDGEFPWSEQFEIR